MNPDLNRLLVRQWFESLRPVLLCLISLLVWFVGAAVVLGSQNEGLPTANQAVLSDETSLAAEIATEVTSRREQSESGERRGLSLTDSRGLLKIPDGSTLEAVEKQTMQRNKYIALLIGAVCLLLSVLFAYLKMEHATRGFYSGRLQSIAVISAMGVVFVFYYLYVTYVAV